MTSLRAFARVVLTGFALAVSLAGCGIVSMSPPAARLRHLRRSRFSPRKAVVPCR